MVSIRNDFPCHTSPNVNTRLMWPANIHHPKHFPPHERKQSTKKALVIRLLAVGVIALFIVPWSKDASRFTPSSPLPRKGTESGRHSGVRRHSFSKWGASMRSYTHAHTSAFRISPGPFPGGERGKKADSSRSETYQHGQWGSSLRPQPPPDWASLLLEGTPGFRYWTFPVNLARRRYYLRVSSLPSCSASWPSCSSAPVIRTNTAVLGENVLRASVPLPPQFRFGGLWGGERGRFSGVCNASMKFVVLAVSCRQGRDERCVRVPRNWREAIKWCKWGGC